MSVEIRDLAVELATALRDEIAPRLGIHGGREHISASDGGRGVGGDVTFEIDERAESFMERFLAARAPGVAFYSEDRGMVSQGSDSEWVLIVDPIDGTRPALAGLESACVSVAAAPLDARRKTDHAPAEPGAKRSSRRQMAKPTMGDVQVGCIVEIKSGRRFVAERGGGIEPLPRLSSNTDVTRMLWTYGLRGRPARMLIGCLEELVDVSSVGGACFDLGSATFDMTRIATGQLDAYIEPGPRIVDEVPGAREAFERVGGGKILNNSPYDLAAAALCLEEAGAIVTDASGRPLDDRPLLGSGHEFQISCVTAANVELHKEICDAIDTGIERLAAASGSTV